MLVVLTKKGAGRGGLCLCPGVWGWGGEGGGARDDTGGGTGGDGGGYKGGDRRGGLS